MNPSPVTHVRFIIGCITLLALASALCGAFLLWKGYNGGGELVMTVNTAIAGMVGFLGQQKPPPTTTSGAIATEVTNPPTKPVETHEATAPIKPLPISPTKL
jgi:hypothetical protein